MNKDESVVIKKYYGSANTCDGFYSLFSNIFSPEKIKTIYILKGGPGCGKSTLIKKVLSKACELNLETEVYFCSSDPQSLDGIIVPELSVAVLDGTAPHTYDPKYPAICENIVNLGAAWKNDETQKIDKEIRQLTVKKRNAYDKAYAYLSSCKGALSVIEESIQGILLNNKMERAIERLVSKLTFQKTDKDTKNIFTDCISCQGNVHLDTFEVMSSTKYFIKDFFGIKSIYLQYLANELISRGAALTISCNPLNPEYINGIYINDADISFTEYNDTYAATLDKKQIPYKIINMARFCDTNAYRSQRSLVKYAEKAYTTLYHGAIRELKEAYEKHIDIEKLYYTITDYSVVEKITQELINKIFK